MTIAKGQNDHEVENVLNFAARKMMLFVESSFSLFHYVGGLLWRIYEDSDIQIVI